MTHPDRHPVHAHRVDRPAEPTTPVRATPQVDDDGGPPPVWGSNLLVLLAASSGGLFLVLVAAVVAFSSGRAG